MLFAPFDVEKNPTSAKRTRRMAVPPQRKTLLQRNFRIARKAVNI